MTLQSRRNVLQEATTQPRSYFFKLLTLVVDAALRN